MKKFTFKGVFDGFRSSVQTQSKPEQEIQETLRPEHFNLKKTFRHGFPHSPTAIAYDAVQKLLAIGDKSGSLRIIGRPGVESHVYHEGESACAVVQIEFLVNDGALVTATADNVLHLWNFRQKSPQVVQSLMFQKEKITCLHLPVASKWMYVGTERGNIHVVHIESFALSGYIINWNKAIELIQKNHPGPVVQLTDNPLDANKLLIAYECGQIVLWDMRGKFAEMRWQAPENVHSISWHHEGKHFVSSQSDGSLCTWPLRPTPKPQSHFFPHAKAGKDGKPDICKGIHKVDLKTSRSGETYTIFSGGLSMDRLGKSPCITVLQGKTTTVLEMEHSVIDFITICESPWASDMQEPYAIVVLLQNDLVLIDLLTPGFPCFESPYPMDLHESPVTCCTFMADCPVDLVPAFYSVGIGHPTNKKTNFSERKWPISGGKASTASESYSEIVITGHQDGSIKFWDASAGLLQILYKHKTAKIFERPRIRSRDSSEDDPFAIQLISLCAESRRLCIAGASGHVILFKFRTIESTTDPVVLEIPITYENFDEGEVSPECDFIPRSLPKPNVADITGTMGAREDGMLRVRPGLKKPGGFQAQLICLTPRTHGSHPGQITALCINSSYGLMAYGNEHGLVIVDIVQKICLINVASPDLYGAQDPYSRVPRSPKRIDAISSHRDFRDDQTQSPGIDQFTGVELSSSPTQRDREHTESGGVSSEPTSPSENVDVDCQLVDGRGDHHHQTHESEIVATTVTSTASASAPASSRRKSSSWKGFNLKRQLTKVDLKIRNTFGDGANKRAPIFYSSPLSPVTISPDTDTASTPNDPDPDKCPDSPAPDLNQMTSMSTTGDGETCNRRDSVTESSVEAAIEAFTLETSNERIHESNCDETLVDPQTMRSIDFNEEPPCVVQTNVMAVEGGRLTRPSDLPLFNDTDMPTVPPRGARAKDKRLMSVPNIRDQASVCAQATHKVRVKRKSTNAAPSSGTGSGGGTSTAAITSGGGGSSGGGGGGVGRAGNFMRRFNKLDSSFSRSRSSSMSSLENISSEAVQCLAFADSYTKKSDPSALIPTLWIGTSLGSVLTLSITLPESEYRKTQPVVVAILGGPIFRLKGSVLSMSFLDCNGALIPYSYEPWKDEHKDTRERRDRTPTKNTNRMSPTIGGGGGQDYIGDRQFVVITSEKQARVVALPSQNCVYRQQIGESEFVVKAEIISLKDSVCLICYVSTGHMMVYSLPSLRPLLDIDFLPLAELSFQTKCKQGIVDPMLSIWGQQLIVLEDTNQISRTFCFSNRGHGLYLATPTELQKFTICAEFCEFIPEMMGELFMPVELPEPPKESFFKGLFGGGAKSLDREELFGESSGKANRSVAKHVYGANANVDALRARASTATSEIGRAHQLTVERGEKLSQLEDRAEAMKNQAQDFSGNAHSLMLRYKDKKWYQL